MTLNDAVNQLIQNVTFLRTHHESQVSIPLHTTDTSIAVFDNTLALLGLLNRQLSATLIGGLQLSKEG